MEQDNRKNNILATIAEDTRRRVTAQKEIVPLEEMQEYLQNNKTEKRQSFYRALSKPGVSLICEIKKASPSKGLIAPEFPYLQIAGEYEAGGASAISVLTEPHFFQGDNRYLQDIAAHVELPLLRKDFTIDSYQIYEARMLGASAVLLICAILDQKQLETYLQLADELGLSALVEAHDAAEIHRAVAADAKIIGVNNRNLKTFQVDIQNSLRLRELVPPQILFVSESGIRTPEDIRELHRHGVDAALIGETLMRAPDRTGLLEKLVIGGIG